MLLHAGYINVDVKNIISLPRLEVKLKKATIHKSETKFLNMNPDYDYMKIMVVFMHEHVRPTNLLLYISFLSFKHVELKTSSG